MLKPIQLQELWYELYAKNREAWLTVLSGSMAPMIQIGDKVLVKRVVPEQIRFGDIIVFKKTGTLITHRVIGKRVDNQNIIFFQKGDSNTIATGVFAENVIGKVACIRKGNKHIRLDSFLGKSMNFLLGANSYVLYVSNKCRLISRVIRLYRRCLHILFL
jgi:signal peptidase I